MDAAAAALPADSLRETSATSDMILDMGLTGTAGTLPHTGLVDDDGVSLASCCCARRLLSFCEIFLGMADYNRCASMLGTLFAFNAHRLPFDSLWR